MIVISNGDITKTVTIGAYNNFYKRMGFEVESSKPKVEIEEAVIVDEDIKDEKPTEEKKEEVKEQPVKPKVTVKVPTKSKK